MKYFFFQDPKCIVCGNPRNPEERVKTHDAKWLRLDNIYEKLARPSYYDIGGTYVSESVADFWFLYETEQIGNLSHIHLFITSHKDTRFTVAVSARNNFKLDNKNSAAFLPVILEEFHFNMAKEHCPNYVTTFSFSNLDLYFFGQKSLYIAVKFPRSISERVDHTIDNIKYNHDFSSLLTDPIFSDFIIESSEGDKFNVHRAILGAQSDVFKAMLREDTAESQNGFVKLVDVSSDDLKFALEFIYTGTIKNIDNCNASNLLAVADQYNIRGLWELVLYVLSKQLTEENALEVLLIADMYNAESLKIAAMKCIKQNPNIVQSKTFKEIKDARLLQELCQYIASS